MTERVVAIKITSDGKAFVVDQNANAEAVSKLRKELAAAGDQAGVVGRQNAAMAETSKLVAATMKDQGYAAQVLAERELAAADAADKFMAKLQRLAQESGKSRTEILAMQAAQHGVTEGATPFINAIDSASKSSHSLSLANAGVTRELLVLGNEVANGNWTRFGSSLNVLGQRSGAAQVAIAALRSPVGLLSAAALVAAGAVAVLTYEHEKLQRTLNSMEVQLTATGRATMFTTTELEGMLHQLQMMPGVSRDAAVQSIEAFTTTHAIGKRLFTELTGIVADYAAATSTKVPEAAKKLAQAFADPQAGAKTLDKELDALTATELAQIEVMTRHGDLAGAQRVLYEALLRSVHNLATEGLTPLQEATHGVSQAWDRMSHSVGESMFLRGVDTVLVGIVNKFAWIIDHHSDIASGLAMIPGIGPTIAAFNFVGSGAKPGNPQASGKVGETEDYKAVQDQIKRVTELNASYVGAAAALEQMKQRESELKNTIVLATQELGAQDPAVKKLKDELAGLQEAMAKKPVNTDAVNAAIEDLKRQGQVQEEVVKQNVARIASLVKQGVISQVDGIHQETAARLAGVAAQQALLTRELDIAKRRVNSQQEQERIRGEIAKLEQTRTGVVMEDENRTAEAEAKIWDESFDNYKKDLDAKQKSIDKTNEQAAVVEQEIATHGKSAQAILEVANAHLENRRAMMLGNDTYAQEIAIIDQQIAANTRLLAALNSKAAQSAVDATAKHAEEAWQRTDHNIEEGLYDAVTGGIGNAGKKALKDLENWAAHVVLRPVVQAIGQFGASVLNPSAASAGSSFGGSLLTSAGGSALGKYGATTFMNGAGSEIMNGTLLSNVAAGYAGVGGSFASTVGAGVATDAMGATVAEGTAAATIGSGSAVGAGLAAIPVYGWVALAALAAYEMMKGGETRVGGQYSGTSLISAPSGGQINGDATTSAIAVTIGQTNALLKELGSAASITGFQSGLEESSAGKGFAYARGSLSTGQNFGNWADEGYMQNRGSMTAEEAAAKFGDELKQATLEALQAADVPGKLGDYLKSLGDIEGLSGGALDAALARVNKALSEKQTLEDQYYALTHTDLENLTKAREKERATLDESNQALYDQVAALTDQKAATEAAAQASQAAAEATAQLAEQRQQLEDKFFDLTHTALETQTRDRQRERDALDASNQALYDRIAALQDQQAAEEAAAAAMASFQQTLDQVAPAWMSAEELRAYRIAQIQSTMAGVGLNFTADQISSATRAQIRELFDNLVAIGNTTAAQALLSVSDSLLAITEPAVDAAAAVSQAATALQQAGKGIHDFIQQLITTRAGTASPEQLLANTRSQYIADLSAARAGDLDANQRIAQSAQAYINAQEGYTASGGQTQAVISQVISELQALPSVKSYETQSLDSLQGILAALDALPDSLTTALTPQLAAAIAEKFGSIDLNGNGITFDEMQVALAGKATDAQLQAVFNVLDANGDGVISQLEALGGTATAQQLTSQQILNRLLQDSMLSYSASEVARVYNDIDRNTARSADYLQVLMTQLTAAGAAPAASTTSSSSSLQKQATSLKTLTDDPSVSSVNKLSAITDYYYASKSSGLTIDQAAAKAGYTADQVSQFLIDSGLPRFDRGINVVPSDMVAMIHKNEAVVPAQFNPALGGMRTDDVAREIRDMKAQLAQLMTRLIVVTAEGAVQTIGAQREAVGAAKSVQFAQVQQTARLPVKKVLA
jgi:DNA repair exonuclease SbcCD ATPase subunit